MTTDTVRAYHRNDTGLLSTVTLLVPDYQLCDLQGYPLTRSEPAETAELLGWTDEGPAVVWHTDGGQEILVPAAADEVWS